MNTYKSLPDLGRLFAQMKLQDQLDAISERTIFGACIRLARHNKQPLELIAKEIIDQHRDNAPVVEGVVGKDTIDLIRKIYPK